MASKRAKSAVVQLKVRLDEPLRAKLERSARQRAPRGVSLNAEIVNRLEQSFAGHHVAIEPDLFKRIEASAESQNLSVAVEVANRLRQSLDRQSLLDEVLALAYGPQMGTMLRQIARVSPRLDVIEPGKKLTLTFEVDREGQVEAFMTPADTGEAARPAAPTDQEFDAAKRAHGDAEKRRLK